MQAWVSCPMGRTTACGPHAQGGDQCGHQRGSDLKHSTTEGCTQETEEEEVRAARFICSHSRPLEHLKPASTPELSQVYLSESPCSLGHGGSAELVDDAFFALANTWRRLMCRRSWADNMARDRKPTFRKKSIKIPGSRFWELWGGSGVGWCEPEWVKRRLPRGRGQHGESSTSSGTFFVISRAGGVGAAVGRVTVAVTVVVRRKVIIIVFSHCSHCSSVGLELFSLVTVFSPSCLVAASLSVRISSISS